MKKKSTTRGQQAKRRPPRLALWLAARAVPAEDREPMLGDLVEEFGLRAAKDPRSARWWLWRQAVRSLPHRLKAGGRYSGDLPTGEGAVSDLLQDLRFGLRSLSRSKIFACVTVITLALAIGVNSTVFSMVGEILLADLPLENPERVAFLRMEHPERGLVRQDLSLPDYMDLRGSTSSFAELAATRNAARVLSVTGEPERVQVMLATSNLLDAWGARTVLGRGFAEGEDRPGAEPVAMLSHGAWSRRFGSDPRIVGKKLEIDGLPVTVVGVMSERMEFADLAAVELWLPLPLSADSDRSARDTFVTGLLAEGRSLAEAQDELAAAFEHLSEQYPVAHEGWQLAVKGSREDLVDDSFWVALTFLSFAVLGILLIACSNVATLHVTRAGERGRELAVRAALGAGRMRIVRQLMTESLLLSLAAAALGLAVTRGLQKGLVWLVGDNSGATHLFRMMSLDGKVLFFSLALALVAPLVFGLIPAHKAVGRNLQTTLQKGGRSGGGQERGRRFLVGFQVAAALALLLAFGALTRSTLEMRSIDLGYDAEAVWTARIDLPSTAYPDEDSRRQFYERAIENVRALPEISAAAFVARRPFDRGRGSTTFRILERPPAREEQLPFAYANVVDPQAFDILPMPALAGRVFTAADDHQGRPVAVVNRETVSRYWGAEASPAEVVGHHVKLGDVGDWVEVVGVVETLPQPSLTSAEIPELYLPVAQKPPEGLALLAHTRGDGAAATLAIRRAIRAVDGRQPVGDVRTLGRMYDDAWAASSALEKLLMSFAIFALAMAGAGIYGVASYTVSRRTRELGLRMALGADRGDVGMLVLRQSTGVLLVGAVIGLSLGAAMIRLLSSSFAGMRVLDPVTWLSITCIFLSVAVLATFVPLRRATSLDPVKALRRE